MVIPVPLCSIGDLLGRERTVCGGCRHWHACTTRLYRTIYIHSTHAVLYVQIICLLSCSARSYLASPLVGRMSLRDGGNPRTNELDYSSMDSFRAEWGNRTRIHL